MILMSEVIDYWGYVRKFKPNDKDELIDLITDFQHANIQYDESDVIEFSVDGGWRGGGHTCEALIQAHFGEFLKNYPHIELEVIATYVEHAPSTTIIIKGEKTNCKDNY